MIENEEDDSDDSFDAVYQTILNELTRLSTGNDPLTVAAIMITQGLSVYKTLLSDAEYNNFVDLLSEYRDEIVPFEQEVLH